MQQLIKRLEATIRKDQAFLGFKLISGFLLLVLYTIQSFRSLLLLLFLPPQKSFCLLYNQQKSGLWQHSYYNHLKFRHNIRFGSASFTLLMATVVVAGNFIISLITPFYSVEITYAATFSVNNLNNAGPGSLRRAISDAAANPGIDTINFTVDGVVNLLSPLLIDDNTGVIIDATGHNIALDGSAIAPAGPVIRIQTSNNTLQNISIQNSVQTGIFIPNPVNNLNLIDVSVTGSTTDGIRFNAGSDHCLLNNVTSSSNGNRGLHFADVNNITITGGDYSNNNNTGIYFTNSSDSTITGSTVTNNNILNGNISGFVLDDTSNIQLNNLTVTGNNIGITGINSSGIQLVQSNVSSNDIDGLNMLNVTGSHFITSNTISNNGRSGLILYGSSTGNVLSDSILDNNGTLGPDVEGIWIKEIGTHDNTISNNVISNSSGSGIKISHQSYGNTVSSNTVSSNTLRGIEIIVQANNNTLQGNTVDANIADGILLSNSSANIINSNNTISNNGSSAIKIDQSSIDNTISNNTFDQNGLHGMLIDNGSDNNTVASNTITDNVGAGLAILNSSADTQITSNQITGNDDGININTSSLNTNIQNNTISSSVQNGIIIQDNSNNTQIAGNTITSNNLAGIVLHDSVTDTNINHDTVSLNSVGVRIDTQSFGNGVKDCTITNNTNNGVFITGQSNENGVLTNTIFGNGLSGIQVDDNSVSNKLSRNIITQTPAIALTDGGNNEIESPDYKVPFASSTKLLIGGEGPTDTSSGLVEFYCADTFEQTTSFINSTTFNNGDLHKITDGDYTACSYISFIYIDPDNNTSIVRSRPVTVDNEPPVSTASPAGGDYTQTQSVVLTAVDNEDTSPRIFYTTDGSTPTVASSEYITTPITIDTDMTLKFFSTDIVRNNESVKTEVYNININTNDNSNDNSNSNTNENTNTNGNLNINENLNLNLSSLINFDIGEQPVDTNTETVRTPNQTPIFHFKDFEESYIGKKVQIIIKQRGETVVALYGKIKRTGRVNITVPEEEALDKGKYKVYTGIENEIDPEFRVNLEIIDRKPKLNLDRIFVPQTILATSTAERLTVSIHDLATDASLVHAVNDKSKNGVFSTIMPYWPKAGKYKIKAQAGSNGVLSDITEGTYIITPNQYVETLITVPGDDFWKRLVSIDNPKIAGIVKEGRDVLIDGNPAVIQLPCSAVCSWYYQMNNVPVGINQVTISVVKDNVTERTSVYEFKRDLPAVTPRIISHENNCSLNKSPLLTVIGHANDKLYIYNADYELIKTATFDEQGSYQFNTLPYNVYGGNTYRFRAQDGMKYSSMATFNFTLRRPVPQMPAPSAPPPATSENNNVNVSSENSNQNSNIENENVNTEVSNTNQNINTETTNTNEAVIIEVNTNSNTDINENININTPITAEEIIASRIKEDYKKTRKEQPPSDLPNLTEKIIALSPAETEQVVQLLNEELKQSDVTLEQNGITIKPEVMTDGTIKFRILKEYDIVSYLNRLFGWQNIIISNNSLIIEGQIPKEQFKDLPAFAIVTVYSDPVIKVAQADANGKWTITIPLELLPAGQHTAFAQTEINSVKSGQVEIAKFVVEEDTKISRTTWLVIVNVIIAVILIIAAIIIQLFKNRRLRMKSLTKSK